MKTLIAATLVIGLIVLAVGGILYNKYRGRTDMGIK